MIRAVVAGASSGIGCETARLLREAGCEMVLVGRSQVRLDAFARELGADRFVADLTDRKSCEDVILYSRANSEGKKPVLVNCAGYALFGGFAEAGAGDAELQIATNLIAPMLLSHACIPWMLDAGGGHIVNVLSIGATHPFPGAAAYCASKAGLRMLTKCLAAEYRDRGVRFTSILPGSVDTPLWDGQAFVPERADMLSPRAVAECIRDVILSPTDRSYDEIVLMPPKGVL